MAPSTCSRSSTSAPQRESEAKASEGDVEDECDQLRRETRELREKLAQHSKQLRKRKLEGFDSPLRREAKQIQENLLAKTNRLKDRCNELEVESTRRLELPQEVWEKITDELDENDLFPLALSCRFFRQKQKELVAQTRKHGPGSGAPRLVLRTNLRRKPEKGQPASAAYVRFCSEEKVPSEVVPQRAKWIRRLAAFHGHLPLLQKLIKPFHKLQPEIIATAAHDAGESSFRTPFFFFFRLLTSFSLSLLHSARRPTGDLKVAETRARPPDRDQSQPLGIPGSGRAGDFVHARF